MSTSIYLLVSFGYFSILGLLSLFQGKSITILILSFLIYPLFAVSIFFADFRAVVVLWLLMAVINVPLHLAYAKKYFTQKTFKSVVTSSFCFWPIQIWHFLDKEQKTEPLTEEDLQKEFEKSVTEIREVLGVLPREVQGVVEFDYHMGTEEGAELIYLREFEGFFFFTSCDIFDQAGIEEGKSYIFSVEEKDGREVGVNGRIAWITHGKETGI
jgi:hypothetical protein